MTKIERFEDLKVWQESRELCKFIYNLTEKKPWSHDFRFKDQIRSSSGSIMDNIAEGFERGGNREFIQFLFVAKGSAQKPVLRFTGPSMQDISLKNNKTSSLKTQQQ